MVMEETEGRSGEDKKKMASWSSHIHQRRNIPVSAISFAAG